MNWQKVKVLTSKQIATTKPSSCVSILQAPLCHDRSSQLPATLSRKLRNCGACQLNRERVLGRGVLLCSLGLMFLSGNT